MLLVACAGVQHSSEQTDGLDGVAASADAPVVAADAGSGAAPRPMNIGSNVFPAAHAPIPPVTYLGGHVMANPKIVTVTFDGDSQRTALEAFGDAITTTPWWKAVSSEYCDSSGACIGPGSGGVYGHIHEEAHTYYSDSAFDVSTLHGYLDARIKSGLLPPPQGDTVYVVYLPKTTTVDLDGATSCQDFAGYHSIMATTPPGATDPVAVPYVVVPRCSDKLDELTMTASHELVESVTDATPYSAFASRDDAWDTIGGGSEVADRCTDYSGKGLDAYREGPWLVQRSWSNAAAKASHDPCVPAPAPHTQPYFNVAPDGPDVITLGRGETKVIPLTAFSDHPMAPFTVEATEVSALYGDTNVLDLKLSDSTMVNGQRGSLTITFRSEAAQYFTAFQLTSTQGGVTHAWYFMVSTN